MFKTQDRLPIGNPEASLPTPSIVMVSEESLFAQRVERFIHSACVEVDRIRFEDVALQEEWARRSTFVCVIAGRLTAEHWPRIDTLHTHVHKFPLVYFLQKGTLCEVVQAMRKGVFNVLVEPFTHHEVMHAINEGLDHRAHLQRGLAQYIQTLDRMNELTMRQRQVLDLLVCGLPNREVADKLGLKPKTVEVHRRMVMSRMQVASFAELIVRVSRVPGFTGRNSSMRNTSEMLAKAEA